MLTGETDRAGMLAEQLGLRLVCRPSYQPSQATTRWALYDPSEQRWLAERQTLDGIIEILRGKNDDKR